LYGMDTNITELYDLVLHIDCINADGAVEIICDVAKRPCFHTTPVAKRKLKELLEAAKNYSNSSASAS